MLDPVKGAYRKLVRFDGQNYFVSSLTVATTRCLTRQMEGMESEKN